MFVDDHKNGSFAVDIQTELHIADRLIANEFNLKAGERLGKHVHDYTHLSILSNGTVKLEKFNKGEDEPFESIILCAAGKAVTVIVSANIYHRITALTDADWFCIHAEMGD